MTVLLSASVPLPERGAKYFETSDVVSIRDAVKAFIQVFATKHRIHFGGHPAITPLVSLMMKRHPEVENERIFLYQSEFYRNKYPDENHEFVHKIYVDEVKDDEIRSLEKMRSRMLTDHPLSAAIFIGGMGGVVEEYKMIRRLQPNARCFPIASTGGAALEIFQDGGFESELKDQLTYRTLFRKISDLAS